MLAMSNMPPRPENTQPISVSLAWNGVSPDARSHMMSTWYDQTGLNSSENTDTYPELIASPDTSADFWEKGYVGEMKKLPEIVDLVKSAPEKFTRKLFYNPKTFACPINARFNYCLHTTPQMPEGEAILDLDSYLGKVKDFALAAGDATFLDQVEGFRSDLGYLSESDFENGTEIIAQSWIDYLVQHPSAKLNIFNPLSPRQKSNGYTLGGILASVDNRLDALAEDDAVSIRDRIRQNSDDWESDDDSKLLVVDDWVISGGSASEFIKEAKAEASKHNLSFDPKNIEIHTIARAEKADAPDGFLYRTVFLNRSERSYREVSMTGAHCTVNYGHEHQIHTMQSYLQNMGIYIEAPHLFKILPSEYRAQDMYKLEAVADRNLIATIARDNKAALKCLQKLADIKFTEQEDNGVAATASLNRKRIMYQALLERLSQRRNGLRKALGVPKGV